MLRPVVVVILGIVAITLPICFYSAISTEAILKSNNGPEADKPYQCIARKKFIVTVTLIHVREAHEAKAIDEKTWETIKPIRDEIIKEMGLAQAADNAANKKGVIEHLATVEQKRKEYLLQAGISPDSVPSIR